MTHKIHISILTTCLIFGKYYNDYKRNEKVCKELKDKHNLTYGKNKSRVKVDKLRGKERVRHEIFHAIKDEIMVSTSMDDLINRLKNRGITTEFKYKRGSDEVQGISFTKDNITFKGSQIDRIHSYKGLCLMIDMVQKKQKKTSVINGKRLTIEQHNNLLNGKTIFIEGMQRRDGSIISGSTGLFDLPADGGDDSEESLFRNRMQRQQKKKKRGLKM